MFADEHERLAVVSSVFSELEEKEFESVEALKETAAVLLKERWTAKYPDMPEGHELKLGLAVISGDASTFYNRFHPKSKNYDPYP